ncbi:DNA polymerase III subunit alpha [Mycoplasma putrefaciens]|uniref:DNA-directed DNA polymerase n=1 Tax=Mycoplasma putrefaciens (strain ATCC 15718 / NCTC 10155 / C30 KS-1 / KS-1) TaxID=743965 RepID=A0A7U3ZSA2_MYCPK|nr:DNA polymerase III subunit alpha [Mycoplasma putrefaciens]AEM68591.1 DNA polymerase III, alpha subunit [Mycoplasma putrefaciens KS1]
MNFLPMFTVKSEYNFLDSLIKIDDYIFFAKKHNFKYAFYCEKNSMYGVAEFVKKAKMKNIKPIIGVSLEFADQTKICIYAKNRLGYQLICNLSSYLYDGFDHSDQEIKQYLCDLLNNNVVIVAKFFDTDFKTKLTDILTTDLYDAEQLALYLQTINYLDSKQGYLYSILQAIRESKTIDQVQSKNLNFYPDNDFLEKNSFSITNIDKITSEIAAKVSFDLFDSKSKYLIKYQAPNNLSTNQFLRQKCLISLKKYTQYKRKTQKPIIVAQYLTRLDYELNVIKTMGFSDYFLVVADYVNFAKKQKIMVGPGRGSAAGSLVSFLLRITDIDPLEYDLLFERFLNPQRATLPDIDVDFQDNRREEILEYLFEKYGKYNVATITTYQTIGYKMAWRDVCRVFKIELNIVNKISKLLDQEKESNFIDFVKQNQILSDYYKDQQFKTIFDAMNVIVGLPRQSGTHAAGVILSDIDLRNVVPIKIGYNGIFQIQYDMSYLEELGLIKMDILGLKNLSTLQDIIQLVNQNYNLNLKLNQIPLNDKKTFRFLQKGDTSGIFQLESKGMTDLIIKMQVDSIQRISDASALYRPGPQEMIPQYLANKKNNNFKVIDDSVYEILKPTFGIIVYQEQVMQMLKKVANFSYAKADIVRRAMSKKNAGYMHQSKQEFISNAINQNHFSQNKANLIWNWIEKFSNYGFNKSHSIAYSYVSYWLAFFKANYTCEFYACLLSGVIGSEVKTQQYIKELSEYQIKINKPTVLNTFFNYQIRKKQIFMPLSTIKGIGNEVVKKLANAKKENNQLFKDFNSFVLAMTKQKISINIIQILIKAGALDNLWNLNKQTMLSNLEMIYNQANAFKNLNTISEEEKVILINYDEFDDETLARFEKELYGFFIEANPILKFKNLNLNYNLVDISKLKLNSDQIILAFISNIKEINDKNNNKMAFISLFDSTGEIEMTIFANDYQNFKQSLELNKAYIFKVQPNLRQNKKSAKFIKLIKSL